MWSAIGVSPINEDNNKVYRIRPEGTKSLPGGNRALGDRIPPSAAHAETPSTVSPRRRFDTSSCVRLGVQTEENCSTSSNQFRNQ